jgi:hypothetical protein
MITAWGQTMLNDSILSEFIGRIFGDETTRNSAPVSNSMCCIYSSRSQMLSSLISESSIN